MNVFMKNLNKVMKGAAAALFFAAGLIGPMSAFAATSPALNSATTYGVLSDTFTNTSAATTINGDVGFTTGPATAPLGAHPNYGSGAPYATAGGNQGSALSALAAQACTFTFAPGPINLSTDTTHGPIGVYAPGVYCSTGAMDVGGPLSLSGSGTYIFRPVGALTSTVGSVVSVTGGASACDVFWTPSAATTLAATTTFLGTVIDDAGISVGASTTWLGRALAFGGTVTTGTSVTITTPTCVSPSPAPAAGQGTLTVIKRVINDNGGTRTSFPMFVNGSSSVETGHSYNFPASATAYVVTETPDPKYALAFSGDCNASGQVTLAAGDNKVCILTNDDIGAPVVVPPVPPIIDVVKVPNPLALPGGPGSVLYTYTARNIGTVPMTNVTMVGDTCSPIVRVSGDTDGDNQLDLNETWVHTCTTTLTETHTNTVVATGWANGLSATDVASATVIVGLPIVPPLIHITKVPSPLTLLAGGGMVTYTKQVTNPGTVALSNVQVTDDKCSPVAFQGGDTNSSGTLDPSETWTYTCSSNLTQTTTNTAIATGVANGLTARDLAIVTVVVAAAAPALPRTGFAPLSLGLALAMTAIGIFSAAALLYVARKKQLR